MIDHWKKIALAVVVALALLQVWSLSSKFLEARILYGFLKQAYLTQQQANQRAAQQKQQPPTPAPIPAVPVN